MGFYENRVLPLIINVAMNPKAIKDERKRCLEQVTGTVLENGYLKGAPKFAGFLYRGVAKRSGNGTSWSKTAQPSRGPRS